MISIIVPVYNKQKYVEQMITSVKMQMFRDFECILVDDGSTDYSGFICDQLTAGDPLFSVIHIKNGGVSHARNTALNKAKGEYITFLDSDDEIPPDYLERIAEDIRRYEVDMVIGAIKRISEDRKNITIIPYPFEKRAYTIQELLPCFAEFQAKCGVFGWCVNKTFKRSLVTECRFNETLTLFEDFDFYLRVYPKINTCFFDSNVFYHYLNERSNFSTFKNSEVDYLAQVGINIRYKQFLEKQEAWYGNNERIVSDAIQRFLFFSVFHSPMERFDERFEKASILTQQAGISFKEKNGLRRLVLFCITKEHVIAAKFIVQGYRTLRRIMKGR